MTTRSHPEITCNNWSTPFEWRGFPARKGVFNGHTLTIVPPGRPRPGLPWIWKTEFLDVFSNAEEELVRRGFHLVYLEVLDHFGSPKAVELGNRLYEYVHGALGLARKVCLLGMSRGGLWAYHWAVANPDRVALIYGDNPVLDITSWPGGYGQGPGDRECWQKCLNIYGISEDEALNLQEQLIERLSLLVEAGVPILHVVGDADEVVPVNENSDLVKKRYRELGGTFEEVVKPGSKHHPHGLPEDPGLVVRFFEQRAIRP